MDITYSLLAMLCCCLFCGVMVRCGISGAAKAKGEVCIRTVRWLHFSVWRSSTTQLPAFTFTFRPQLMLRSWGYLGWWCWCAPGYNGIVNYCHARAPRPSKLQTAYIHNVSSRLICRVSDVQPRVYHSSTFPVRGVLRWVRRVRWVKSRSHAKWVCII